MMPTDGVISASEEIGIVLIVVPEVVVISHVVYSVGTFVVLIAILFIMNNSSVYLSAHSLNTYSLMEILLNAMDSLTGLILLLDVIAYISCLTSTLC